MKKRLLSLLTALCLMLTLAPAANAVGAGVPTEAELRSAVESGGSISLGANITISAPLSITKATTINGQNYAITYTGSSAAYAAIQITTNGQVTLQNLTINATSANGRAIKLDSASPKFTLQNSVLNAGQRGIWVGNPGCDTNSVITVTDTIIKNSQLPAGKTYDTWVAYGTDYRGISLWNMNNAEVNITNCQILGFSYGLNAGGETNGVNGANYNGSTIAVTNPTIKGWAAYYLWGANSVTSFTDCTLVGISDISGDSNNFAVISIAENMYLNSSWQNAVVKFFGGSITGVRYNTSLLSLFNVDQALKTRFEFLENDDMYMPQLKYYSMENVEGNPEYYVHVWNFYPTTTPAMSDEYLSNNVTGYGLVEITAGTIADYEGAIAVQNIAFNTMPVEETTTCKSVHIGGGV